MQLAVRNECTNRSLALGERKGEKHQEMERTVAALKTKCELAGPWGSKLQRRSVNQPWEVPVKISHMRLADPMAHEVRSSCLHLLAAILTFGETFIFSDALFILGLRLPNTFLPNFYRDFRVLGWLRAHPVTSDTCYSCCPSCERASLRHRDFWWNASLPRFLGLFAIVLACFHFWQLPVHSLSLLHT